MKRDFLVVVASAFCLLSDARTYAAAPQIIQALADNRGQVILTADEALNPATVNTSSVLIYTAGADGILGTADDVQQSATVSYNAATDQIVATATIPAGTQYRVDALGSQVAAPGGTDLDGEPWARSTYSN